MSYLIFLQLLCLFTCFFLKKLPKNAKNLEKRTKLENFDYPRSKKAKHLSFTLWISDTKKNWGYILKAQLDKISNKIFWHHFSFIEPKEQEQIPSQPIVVQG